MATAFSPALSQGCCSISTGGCSDLPGTGPALEQALAARWRVKAWAERKPRDFYPQVHFRPPIALKDVPWRSPCTEQNVGVKLHNEHLPSAQEEQPEHSSAAIFPLIKELELKRAGLELSNPVGLFAGLFPTSTLPLPARQSSITAQMK